MEPDPSWWAGLRRIGLDRPEGQRRSAKVSKRLISGAVLPFAFPSATREIIKLALEFRPLAIPLEREVPASYVAPPFEDVPSSVLQAPANLGLIRRYVDHLVISCLIWGIYETNFLIQILLPEYCQ